MKGTNEESTVTSFDLVLFPPVLSSNPLEGLSSASLFEQIAVPTIHCLAIYEMQKQPYQTSFFMRCKNLAAIRSHDTTLWYL